MFYFVRVTDLDTGREEVIAVDAPNDQWARQAADIAVSDIQEYEEKEQYEKRRFLRYELSVLGAQGQNRNQPKEVSVEYGEFRLFNDDISPPSQDADDGLLTSGADDDPGFRLW